GSEKEMEFILQGRKSCFPKQSGWQDYDSERCAFGREASSRGGNSGQSQSSWTTPHLCDAPIEQWSRSARHPGDARACEPVNDATLHAFESRSADRGI